MRIARVIDIYNREVLAALQTDGRMLRVEGDMLVDTPKITDEVVEAQRWLPPVEPRVIICIGLNYRRHARWCWLDTKSQTAAS